jgi:hypothetical protein
VTTIFLTVADVSPWTVPSDWDSANNSIECIGGGGGASSQDAGATFGAGGGGGAYSKIVNLTLTAGGTAEFQVGAAGPGGQTAGSDGSPGTDTWFNGASAAAASVWAKPGLGADNDTGGAGGPATGTGTTQNAGGAGGNNTGVTSGGSGGGGAGGPNGAGQAGGTITGAGAQFGGGGGGGADGGTAGAQNSTTTGGAGGNNFSGVGSGAGGLTNTDGTDGTLGGGGGGGGGGTSDHRGGDGGAGQQFDSSHGAGGGGGGAGSNNNTGSGRGGHGGLYGGGGGANGYNGARALAGNGADGVICITYTPLVITVTTPSGGGDSTRLRKRGRRPKYFWQQAIEQEKKDEIAEAAFDAVADAYLIESNHEFVGQVNYINNVEGRLRAAKFYEIADQLETALKDLKYKAEMRVLLANAQEEAELRELMEII